MTFIVDDLDGLDFEFLSEEDDDKSGVQLLLEALSKYHPDWILTGKHPTFYINRWVQITVASNKGAYCRIINARKHDECSATWGDMQAQIQEKLAWLQKVKIYSHIFLKRLYEAYQYLNLDSDKPKPVPLKNIYEYFYKQHPNYRREYFGLKLHHLIESQNISIEETKLICYPSANPHKSFCIFDEHGQTQYLNSIAFKK